MVGYHYVVISFRSYMMDAGIVNDKQIIAEDNLHRIYKVIGN